MKRIVIAVTTDLNTDQRVLRIASALEELDFEVTLFGRELKNSKPLNVKQPAKRVRLLLNKGVAFYALFNWRLFWYLIFHRVDIVLANDLDTLVGAAIASILKQKPLVYDSHEYFTQLPELVNRPKKQRVWLKAEQLFLPRATVAYTVCQSLADIYSVSYSKPFGVVRNVPFRKHLPSVVTAKQNVIIYQGALNVGRGIELMIQAMHYLPDYQLWIAGYGDVEQQLKQLANEQGGGGKVVFLGRLLPNELHQITQQAKVGLSLEEDLGLNYHYALPNKLFDYIQAHVPVVVANLPEMKNIVEQYGVGQVLYERTPQQLATTICNVCNNTDKYTDNLQKAAVELCWENEKTKLFNLYTKLK